MQFKTAKRGSMRWFVLLIGMMLILAGCQTAGGLDLNKAMMGQMSTESLEGRMEIALDLEFLDTLSEWSDTEEIEVAKALDGLKIVFAEIKQENLETASFKGSLVIRRGEIPFHVYMDQRQLIFAIEGAGAPIALSMDDDGLPMSGGLSGGLGFDRNMQNKEMLEALGSLFFKHLDNPKSLSVQRVLEPVNGESLYLYKARAAMNGPEMMEAFVGLLAALTKDDEGLRKVIELIYDAAMAELEGADVLPPGIPFGQDREMDIELMHVSIKQALLFALASMEAEDSPVKTGLNAFFTEETGAVAELYFDNDLNLRKNYFELTVAPDLEEMGDDSGVRSVKLTITGEYWNHNGAVEAELPANAEEAYTLFDMEGPDEWLRQIDKESVLYQWLKEDLRAMRKTVTFTLVPETAEAAEDADEDADEAWEDAEATESADDTGEASEAAEAADDAGEPAAPSEDAGEAADAEVPSDDARPAAEAADASDDAAEPAEAAESPDGTAAPEDDGMPADWEFEDWELEDWELENWELENWDWEDEWESEQWDEWWWYPVEERPFLQDGRMMAPARYFAESLGLDLEWDGDTFSVTITGGDPETVIVLTVDSSIAAVNGAEQDMGVPVILRDGRAYIPLRFVSEALGAKVEWLEEINMAIVTLD